MAKRRTPEDIFREMREHERWACRACGGTKEDGRRFIAENECSKCFRPVMATELTPYGRKMLGLLDKFVGTQRKK